MKVVINRCYGGFNLSPKGIKRFAELKGKECYFFKWNIQPDTYEPLTLEQAEEHFSSIFAFTIPNPQDFLLKEKRDSDGTYKEYNKKFKEIDISVSDVSRSDPDLVKVVEELGKEASGNCSELKIVEIPDNISYEIDEYDGMESIHEVHRSWN
jgi:hypothetical protein